MRILIHILSFCRDSTLFSRMSFHNFEQVDCFNAHAGEELIIFEVKSGEMYPDDGDEEGEGEEEEVKLTLARIDNFKVNDPFLVPTPNRCSGYYDWLFGLQALNILKENNPTICGITIRPEDNSTKLNFDLVISKLPIPTDVTDATDDSAQKTNDDNNNNISNFTYPSSFDITIISSKIIPDPDIEPFLEIQSGSCQPSNISIKPIEKEVFDRLKNTEWNNLLKKIVVKSDHDEETGNSSEEDDKKKSGIKYLFSDNICSDQYQIGEAKVYHLTDNHYLFVHADEFRLDESNEIGVAFE